MRTAIVLGFICIILTSSHAAGAESLRCEPGSLDLGELRTGPSLGRKVTLTNTGASSLEIIDLKGSCGCLRPTVAQTRLAAGAKVDLILAVHTLSANAGPQAWNVKVHYRQDEEEHTLSLPVRAVVMQEVVVQPPLILVNASGPTQHEFTVTDRRPTTFKLLKVEATSPHLKVGEVKEEADAKGRLVRRFGLEINKDLPAGRHEEQLVLHTDDPVHRELRVLLSIQRRGRQSVEAVPASVEVVASSSQSAISRVVTLRELQGQPLVIDRVETGDPAIAWNTSAGSSATSSLRLTIDPANLHADTLRSQVKVHFKEPAGESVVIPVTVIRR